MKSRRVGEIDVLRFIFSMIVLLRHGEYVVGSLKSTLFPGGAFAVEFFFLVSGYLMMASIEKAAQTEERISLRTIGRETRGFLSRKIGSFYPELLISLVIGGILLTISQNWSLWQGLKLFRASAPEALLIERFGFNTTRLNPADWYLSTMVICMAILYPLVRTRENLMAELVLPLFSLFLLGVLCIKTHNLRGPSDMFFFTYKGNLRGLAEIGLGVALYPLTQALARLDLNRTGKTLVTIVKWVCYLLCIRYMSLSKWDSRDYVYLLVFAAGVLLSFSRQGIDADWFNGKFSSFLGKLSLSLYLGHFYWAANAHWLYPAAWSVPQKLTLYVAVSTATAALIMVLAGLYRKAAPGLKRGLGKLLLKA